MSNIDIHDHLIISTLIIVINISTRIDESSERVNRYVLHANSEIGQFRVTHHDIEKIPYNCMLN